MFIFILKVFRNTNSKLHPEITFVSILMYIIFSLFSYVCIYVDCVGYLQMEIRV